jgi:hypothetical protein
MLFRPGAAGLGLVKNLQWGQVGQANNACPEIGRRISARVARGLFELQNAISFLNLHASRSTSVVVTDHPWAISVMKSTA